MRLCPLDRDECFNNLVAQYVGYTEALETFDQAINLAPKDAFAYTGKGYALLGLLRYQEADTAFERALEFAGTDFPFAAKGRAYTLQALARSRQGIQQDWRVSSSELNTVMAHLTPGASSQAIKHEEESQARLDEATYIDPEDREAYLKKAQEIPIPWWLRPNKHAMATYEHILQQDSSLLAALKRQQEAPLDQALHERLMIAYELATEPEPPDALAYRNKAIMLWVLHQPEEAEKALEKARAIDPDTELPASISPDELQPIPQSSNGKRVALQKEGQTRPFPRSLVNQGGRQGSRKMSPWDPMPRISGEQSKNQFAVAMPAKEAQVPAGVAGVGVGVKEVAHSGKGYLTFLIVLIVLFDLIVPALVFDMQYHSWWFRIAVSFLVLLLLLLGVFGRNNDRALAIIASFLLGLCWGGVGWISGTLFHSIVLSVFMGLLGFVPLFSFHLFLFRKR